MFAEASEPGIYVTALDGTEPKRVVAADSGGLYEPQSRMLLFLRGDALFAQPFDLQTLSVSGEARPVASHVETSTQLGTRSFSVSETGTLVYGVGSGALANAAQQMTWLDRSGKILGTAGPPGNYRGIDISPDGLRIAAHRHDGNGGDIWLTELESAATTRFTFNATQDNSSPIWAPDGSAIAYASLRNKKWGLYTKPANGAGTEQRRLESSTPIAPTSWTADGRALVYVASDPTTLNDFWMVPLQGDQKPVPVVRGPENVWFGQVSPDGKWLAYRSDETGANQLFVIPFPAGPGKWQVSAGHGSYPRWRRDGRELFFLAGASRAPLMAVDVGTDPATFKAGAPKALFNPNYSNLQHQPSYHPFAVAADGQRFLIPLSVSSSTEVTTQPIAVVLNWAQSLQN
jgi:eukaryotic-like serine/threonine-protein kinase